MERIIVRRGRFFTFELLRRTFGADLSVEILWDRRQADRRQVVVTAPQERRRTERRSRPPDEWDSLNYIVISGRGGVPRRSTRTDPPVR